MIDQPREINIQLMGKDYKVSSGLTIIAAIEYAGYKLVRGAGCRAGFCGACPTLYRRAGSHKLYTALACQTLAEDGMCLVQVPFVPVVRRPYDIEEVAPSANIILQYYPEVAACVSCNTCTRACPQGISVMDYIQTALRGDIEQTALLSFDCISCGICSSRCPADIKHYPVGQLARRIYSKYLLPRSSQLADRLDEMETEQCEVEVETMMHLSTEELRARYEQRSFETVAGRDQKHSAIQKWGTAVDPVDYRDEVEEVAY